MSKIDLTISPGTNGKLKLAPTRPVLGTMYWSGKDQLLFIRPDSGEYDDCDMVMVWEDDCWPTRFVRVKDNEFTTSALFTQEKFVEIQLIFYRDGEKVAGTNVIRGTFRDSIPVLCSGGSSGGAGQPGEQGPQGPQGIPGQAGQPGQPGATGPQGQQGIPGEPGQQGPAGADGAQGPQGLTGQAATIQIGAVTTLSPGSAATVTNSGTPSNVILNFGLPVGGPPPPPALTGSLSGGGEFEFGHPGTLNWTWSNAVVSQSLDHGIGSLDPSLRTYSLAGLGITGSRTYTITGNDGHTTATSDTTFNFRHRRYWGVSPSLCPKHGGK